jgi:isoquinoline 1-oxidoreductase beta subunit
MVALTVNGQRREVAVDGNTPLLWVLREHLQMTGTKFGCGIASCGACTVHIDGKAVRSCAMPVALVEGKSVTTIEGLSPDGSHPLQKAWIAEQVPQCGYCQSGQIMQAAELLATNKNPSREDIVAHMDGNICAAARICGSSAPFSAPRGRANAMTIHQSFANLSRRDFLEETAAGLTFAFTVATDPLRITDALADEPLAANAWISIATDGTIAIVSPAAEMGQGSFTTLPAIVAEELDADWAKVKPVLPPEWDEKKYGNQGFGGTFQTSASASVNGYFKPLRIAGAQARRVLIEAVTAKWNVPASELSTEPSVVVHKTSGRRIGYGEIAAFAKAPAEMPKITEADLKSPANFRLIGKDLPRVEVPLKVRGAIKYAMDVQVPGMVYAAVLQSPYFGGAPQTVDDAAARQVPGVTDVVRLPDGVAVIGTSVEATQAAKNLLKATWGPAPGANYDSEAALEEFAAVGRACLMRRPATPRRPCSAPHGCSGASTAPATSITPRWSR